MAAQEPEREIATSSVEGHQDCQDQIISPWLIQPGEGETVGAPASSCPVLMKPCRAWQKDEMTGINTEVQTKQKENCFPGKDT